MVTAVLAEKPSVARDIAAVLGARAREQGCLRGNGYVVTWAIGHLVVLPEPQECNPLWKNWRLSDLPMLPAEWPLQVAEPTRDQFANVKRVLQSPEVTDIVAATDAGREGELIFRYVYEATGCNKPVRRLWISSLTPDAIAKGFRELRDAKEYDALARAARARSRADWLVGMNLSRAYSIVCDGSFSVGRVQTPTLAMVVQRELEIRAFVPEDYCEVHAKFGPTASAPADGSETYVGVWFRGDSRRLPKDGEEARQVQGRTKTGAACIESVKKEKRNLPPPLLYDLTELQRHANRLFGMSAQRTLDVAQSLYEKRKLLSYPRTDSRHLSHSIAETLPAVVRTIAGPYRPKLAPGTGERPLGSRFVDDAQTTDHHAILPTVTPPPSDLSNDERRIYDLVCRRVLQAWHEDYVYSVTNVVTRVTSDEVDRFASTGTSVERVGWKTLDLGEGKTDATTLPGGLEKGDTKVVLDAKVLAKQTRPPLRLTDATLLTAMERAGRAIEEKELADAMRECGLGTPSTRAAILEVLLKREYMDREGKSLKATEKGIALIDAVHTNVKTPAMTGEWEAKLRRIERGVGDFDAFMRGIEEYVREVVTLVRDGGPVVLTLPHASSSPGAVALPASPVRSPHPSSPPLPPPSPPSRSGPSPSFSLAPSPSKSASSSPLPVRLPPPAVAGDLRSLLHDRFGFSSFRPYQEDVCRAVTQGRDVLLVMPTGAGKSLCYQLPGIARGGTTLVVSPLIALMEDQVQKLVAQGVAAERIHSGKTREESRNACRAYLDGKLDFLFIAPERLKVPGFPEMLARRPPSLIAVDEAHCISQWGHDFRPDYRLLGERLPLLRPAPIVALTATATPRVRDDIVKALGLQDALRFVHGFRRTNIAIDVVPMIPFARPAAVSALLSEPARRPAIVYAPTRRETEELADSLATRFRATAYHAGMTAAARDQAQHGFLEGDIEIVVATIAFGMGIDKPNVRTVVHTALPGTLEGYYQEIGRAGRDGALSRAVLFYSPVDLKTHEFFHQRDYPDISVLHGIFAALSNRRLTPEALHVRCTLAPEVFAKAFEKLRLHGGAQIDSDETVRRGTPDYARSYAARVAHQKDQLARMKAYADRRACRMLQLVVHFGDASDPGTPCGHCDACAPAGSAVPVQGGAGATEAARLEKEAAQRILKALARDNGQTVGQLHRDLFPRLDFDRRSFEHVLGQLVQAKSVRLEDDSFTKDGEEIAFKRVYSQMPGAKERRRPSESWFGGDHSKRSKKKKKKRRR